MRVTTITAIREDIAMLAALGFGSYRFSVEWSRIEPEPGEFSHQALDHYRRMVACCREHGLDAVVTLHHFTSPRWLAAEGGFAETTTIDDLFVSPTRLDPSR